MAERTTRDVECRKCGARGRVPITATLAGFGHGGVVCARRLKNGFRCLGEYKLAAPKPKTR